MTSNIKLLSFDGNRYGGLPKRFTRKNPRMISIRGFCRRNGKEENYLPASLTHRRKNIVFDSSCRSVKIDNRCGGLSEYILKSPWMLHYIVGFLL